MPSKLSYIFLFGVAVSILPKVIDSGVIPPAVIASLISGGGGGGGGGGASHDEKCKVPANITGTNYVVLQKPNATAGLEYYLLKIKVVCDVGYALDSGKDHDTYTCVEGDIVNWPVCEIKTCGRTYLDIPRTSSDRKPHLLGVFPWKVEIYSTDQVPHKLVCGGTLVSLSAVVTAANCFFEDSPWHSSRFIVAAGKEHMKWESIMQPQEQRATIEKIEYPAHFFGKWGYYQENIAVAFLQKEFTYTTAVRPICLDFKPKFANKQLKDGNTGIIIHWDIDNDAQVINNLPYKLREVCEENSFANEYIYFSRDKICAGEQYSLGLCNIDTGGGYVFADNKNGTLQYYLRGVVNFMGSKYDDSVHKKGSVTCAVFKRLFITDISAHEYFLVNTLNTSFSNKTA